MNISFEYDGRVFDQWSVKDVREMDIPSDIIDAAIIDAHWQIVRDERNKRLSLSDWTQVSDSPLDETQKQKWQSYRQLLRDVTKQTDPTDIQWPDLPSSD
jgi:hypothetical protein